MKVPGRVLRGRMMRASIALLAVATSWQTPVSGAAFTSSTLNTANSASTLAVAPPASASVTLSLNLFPLLTCGASVSWSASTTPGVTKYEVVRVFTSSGNVSGGPWIVNGLGGYDSPLPLLSSNYQWRVRSILGTNWRSSWKVATVTNGLLC